MSHCFGRSWAEVSEGSPWPSRRMISRIAASFPAQAWASAAAHETAVPVTSSSVAPRRRTAPRAGHALQRRDHVRGRDRLVILPARREPSQPPVPPRTAAIRIRFRVPRFCHDRPLLSEITPAIYVAPNEDQLTTFPYLSSVTAFDWACPRHTASATALLGVSILGHAREKSTERKGREGRSTYRNGGLGC
jgi:hypothetical protein